MRRAGALEVTGQPTCTLGHQIPRAPGEAPDGVFAAWDWDGATLRVWNDRYGFYPLYYFADDDRVCVSPSVMVLLTQGAPTDLDDRALAVLVRLGCFIGEDTPFRHIRALPPSAVFEWTAGELRVSGRATVGRPGGLGRAAALDGFIALVRQAVGRRLPSRGEFAMPLSGGRDSRHLLLELCAAGFKPAVCITLKHYPPRPNEDAAVASTLTAALGLPHVVLGQTGSRLREELGKNLKIGMCSYEHVQYMPMVRYLEGRYHTSYDGLGGDTLTGSGLLNAERAELYENGRLRELALSLFRNDERTLGLMLAPELYRRLSFDLALQHLSDALAEHVDAPCPVDSFRFWNMSRRELTLPPYRLMASVPEVFCPYIDHDVYDLLASLPTGMLLDRTFHTDAIYRAFPAYRHVRFEDRRTAPRWDIGFSRRFASDLLRWSALRGPSRVLRQGWLLPRWLRSVLTTDPGRIEWYYPRLVIYLLQLEGLVRLCESGARERLLEGSGALG
jgi:asparagine synthetase B (glutamine-hydrolysing)